MDAHSGRISHYRVLGELGRDRLGYVLRAADEQLDRAVVLRVVRAASVFSKGRVAAVRAGFQRDARRAAAVSHPNLVTIYAFEAIGDIDLIAMEQVEGASLRAMLGLGDRWRVPEAAKLVARIADAVAAAHAARMAHGRLSLANVVVRHDGRVKVLDLGIPKLHEAEPFGTDGAVEAGRTGDVAGDVLALGMIAYELASSAHRAPGALWRPAPLTEELVARFADAAGAKAQFGVLGPVLSRTFAPGPGEALRDAAAFRDFVVASLGEHRTVAAEAEDLPLGTGTKLVMPVASAAGAPEPVVDDDAAALTTDLTSAHTPRLVLPADLAGSGPAPPPGSAFVVMENAGVRERLRSASDSIGSRLGRRSHSMGSGAVIAAALVFVLLVAGLFAAHRYMSSGGASAAILARNAQLGGGDPTGPAGLNDRATETAPATGVPQPDSSAAAVQSPPATLPVPANGVAGEAVGSAAVDSAAPAPVLRAVVRATPAGASIRVRGLDESWTGDTELAVKQGDSLIVQFSKPGYVTATRTFTGSRISVALQPDSVFARLESNVPADVYLVGSGRAATRRMLGNTGPTGTMVRLPTGTHRLLFRAPDQADWTTQQPMPEAGQTYRVRKTDFATTGSLVITVPGSWAFVSIDGGESAETPVRVERLPIGTHQLRISREGFVTISDTVVIRAGRTATKQYTLRPAT
jgi:hypothetical protein